MLEDGHSKLINLRGHIFGILCVGKGVAVLAMGKLEVLLSELGITHISQLTCYSNQFKISI